MEPESSSSSSPPLSGAVVSDDERKRCGTTEAIYPPPSPRVAWENNTTTEKHTKRRNILSRALKAAKRYLTEVKTERTETEVSAFVPEQELPHTSSVEPTDARDPLKSEPTATVFSHKQLLLDFSLRLKAETKSAFIVFWKLFNPGEHYIRTDKVYHLVPGKGFKLANGYFESHFHYCSIPYLNSENRCIHEGSYMYKWIGDYEMDITFVRKLQPEDLIELPGFPVPLSREATTMFLLQKPPTIPHVMHLYDMIVEKDRDILVLERSRDMYVTLFEFLDCKCWVLRRTSDLIIRQLRVALVHCMDRGVYLDANMDNIHINMKTPRVMLMDFKKAKFIGVEVTRSFAEAAVNKKIHNLQMILNRYPNSPECPFPGWIKLSSSYRCDM